MNQGRDIGVCKGESSKVRRYPGITHEDVEVLRTLGPVARRSFETFARRDKRQRRFEDSQVPVDDVTPTLDQVLGASDPRSPYGAGGGRRRPTHPGAE